MTSSSSSVIVPPPKPASLWDRLEKEKQRQETIRARLASFKTEGMQ